MKKNLLIIGGGRLLGYYLKKEFKYSTYNIYFFNRGISKINNLNYKNYIIGNRNFEKDLKKIPLKKWDYLIDTSCYELSQIKILLKNIPNINQYILISSIYVNFIIDKSIKFNKFISDLYIKKNIKIYAKNKLRCEEFLIKSFKNKVQIYRPGPIIGKFDFSNRLEIWKKYSSENVINNNFKNKRFQIVSAKFVTRNILRNINKNIEMIELPGCVFSYEEFYYLLKKLNYKKNHKISKKFNLLPYLIFDKIFPGKKENKKDIIDLIKKI